MLQELETKWALYERWRAAGKCVACGGERRANVDLTDPDYFRCIECEKRLSERLKRLEARFELSI